MTYLEDRPHVLPSGILYTAVTMTPGDVQKLRRAYNTSFGQQIIGKETRANPGAPSTDFFLWMNAGLLGSIIALIAALSYLVLTTAGLL